MKKILIAGLLAISAMSLTQQHASAWVNSRFGLGLNWDWQSGGNTFLWGLWRNGQSPQDPYGHPHHRPPMTFGMQQPTLPPSYSGAPQGYIPVPPGFVPAQPAPAGAYMPMQPIYQASPYMPATYLRPVYYYPSPYAMR